MKKQRYQVRIRFAFFLIVSLPISFFQFHSDRVMLFSLAVYILKDIVIYLVVDSEKDDRSDRLFSLRVLKYKNIVSHSEKC